LKTLAFNLVTKIDSSLKSEVVKWSAFYEHRIRLGSVRVPNITTDTLEEALTLDQKYIFHLEAFVAKVMRILEAYVNCSALRTLVLIAKDMRLVSTSIRAFKTPPQGPYGRYPQYPQHQPPAMYGPLQLDPAYAYFTQAFMYHGMPGMQYTVPPNPTSSLSQQP
jgi:hypothetical protein